MFKNKYLKSITLTSSLIFASGAWAQSTDLLSLYKNAVNYDADIAAARSALLAEQEDENVALANLLPALSAQASKGHTDSNKELSDDDSFYTTRYSVSLTQPLFNLPSWHGLNASELNSLRAQSVYLSEQQNLILSVASAYFKVLREQENLTTSVAEVAAFKRQHEQAQEQFEVGLIAITDVHEAKATYDSALTSRIRSEGNLTRAYEELSRLTGKYTTELHALKKDFPIELDKANNADSWAESAAQNNLAIKVAEYAMKSLEQDLKAKRAGHYPSLTLSANYEHSDFENIFPEDNETLGKSVFINLDLPLYSGGSTQAGVRKSRFLVEQAKQQLISAQRQAQVDVRSEYINLQTNIQTVDSLQQNIISRESALEATREGYNVGTRNIVEVLDAERNYFKAQRDYANARFDVVESGLRLKAAAGVLSQQDIEELNKWLSPQSE